MLSSVRVRMNNTIFIIYCFKSIAEVKTPTFLFYFNAVREVIFVFFYSI